MRTREATPLTAAFRNPGPFPPPFPHADSVRRAAAARQGMGLEALRRGDFAAAAGRLRAAAAIMPSFADADWNLGR